MFESARRTWSTMVKKVEFSFLSYVSYVSYEPTLWKSAGGLSSSVVVSESVLSTLLPSKPSDVASDVLGDVAKEETRDEAAWHEWCVRSTLTCDQKRRRAGGRGGEGGVRLAARRGGAERGARGV